MGLTLTNLMSASQLFCQLGAGVAALLGWNIPITHIVMDLVSHC